MAEISRSFTRTQIQSRSFSMNFFNRQDNFWMKTKRPTSSSRSATDLCLTQSHSLAQCSAKEASSSGTIRSSSESAHLCSLAKPLKLKMQMNFCLLCIQLWKGGVSRSFLHWKILFSLTREICSPRN